MSIVNTITRNLLLSEEFSQEEGDQDKNNAAVMTAAPKVSSS